MICPVCDKRLYRSGDGEKTAISAERYWKCKSCGYGCKAYEEFTPEARMAAEAIRERRASGSGQPCLP